MPFIIRALHQLSISCLSALNVPFIALLMISPLSAGKMASVVSRGCWQVGRKRHWRRKRFSSWSWCTFVFCSTWQLARCSISLWTTSPAPPVRVSERVLRVGIHLCSTFPVTPSHGFPEYFPRDTPAKFSTSNGPGHTFNKVWIQVLGGVPSSIFFPSVELIATSYFCSSCFI